MKKTISVVLVFFVVLEVLGRIIIRAPVEQGREFISDAELGWVLPPDQRMRWENQDVRINSLGLRSAPVETRRSTRILFVGDSSVFGDGVGDRDTMTAQLERIVGKQHSVDVQNGGIPGYTCLQSRAQVQRLEARFRPDILVINNMHSDYRQIGPTDQVLLKNQLGRWSGTGLGKVYSLLSLRGQLMFGDSKLTLREYRTCLSGLASDQQERGGHSIFLVPITEPYFPDSPVYGEPEPEPPGKRLADYRSAMQEVAEQYASPFVDPSQAMIQRGLNGSEVLIDVVHPSARGHRIIAEEIASVLQDRGMLQNQE